MLCCKTEDIEEESTKSTGCSLISLILFCICMLGGLITTCVGFVSSDKIATNLNIFECSVLKIYYEAKFGQIESPDKKWVGFANFPDIIKDLNLQYDRIEDQYRSIYKTVNDINEDENNLIKDMQKLYNNNYNRKVTNPNATSPIKEITPDFLTVIYFELNFFIIFY